MNTPYRDRAEAGRELARRLASYSNRPDVIVLGLPRGGVPVALEIAKALGAPLDIFLVRKLGFPGHPEVAMGAIASGDVQVLNASVLSEVGVTKTELAEVAARETTELKRREEVYRRGRVPLKLGGNTLILVDDGLATGASMRAAIAAVAAHRPSRVVVAVPVGAPEACATIAGEVDELVCPLQPENFQAVGHWYLDFGQTSDDIVRQCLDQAMEEPGTLSGRKGVDAPW